jgi:thiamine transport system permease protein
MDVSFSNLLQPWILQAVSYTFTQAFWSAFLSTVIGLACARLEFWKRPAVSHFVSKIGLIPFALPSVLISFGLIQFFGNNGSFNSLLKSYNLPPVAFLYEPHTLVLAHVFVYLGYAWRNLSLAYQRIPVALVRNSQLLKFDFIQEIKWLEWPALWKPFFQSFVLIFLSCLTSFSLALTLGGSPDRATTEVVVYQLIRFEGDFSSAFFIASLQMSLAFLVATIGWFVRPDASADTTQSLPPLPQKHSLLVRIFCFLFYFLIALFWLGPLAHLIRDGLSFWIFKQNFSDLFLEAFWSALRQSVSAAAVALGLLQWKRLPFWPVVDTLLWMIIPLSPTFLGALLLMFASGQSSFDLSAVPTAALVVITQVCFAVPLAVRVLEPAQDLFVRNFRNPMQLLNCRGATYWHLQMRALSPSLVVASALCFTFSLGEAGISSLLSNETWHPLPVLLLDLMGSYRFGEASFVAFVLIAAVAFALLLAKFWGAQTKRISDE